VTTLTPKGISLSGYAYGNPLRQRLTAQSKPKDISGGIEVAIGDIATVRANVSTINQSLRNIGQSATPGTCLRGTWMEPQLS
jgi:hypothetical protein